MQPLWRFSASEVAALIKIKAVSAREVAEAALARLDAEWAAWQQRIDAARVEWTGLQGAADLSDLQRKAAMERYVQAHFSADERRLAQALLGL